MVTQKRYRYFMYSSEQHKMRLEVEKKLGKKYIPGKVFSAGKWREYTELTTKPKNSRFADSKLVAEGYLEEMKYKESSSVWGG